MKSQTYDYEKNDHINRANMARLCGEYFRIKDVSDNLLFLLVFKIYGVFLLNSF